MLLWYDLEERLLAIEYFEFDEVLQVSEDAKVSVEINGLPANLADSEIVSE